MMKKKLILTNADDSKRIGVVVYSIQELKSKGNTVVCRIVRRLLISVHKWQFTGMADTHEY